MTNRRKYNKTQLKNIVRKSISIAQVLKGMNIIPAGGNYKTIKQYIKLWNIDISHFKGQAANKGKTFGPKRDIVDYLSNKFPIQSSKLKLRLFKEKIFERKCQQCGLKRWQGKTIPLEIDHINGNSHDNSLLNLRILCPNCHALTSTYRGKNISKNNLARRYHS